MHDATSDDGPGINAQHRSADKSVAAAPDGAAARCRKGKRRREMADHTRRLRLRTLLLLLLANVAESGWFFGAASPILYLPTPPMLSVTPMDMDLLHAVELINPIDTYNLLLPPQDPMPQAHPSSTMDALNAINSGGMMHYNIADGGTLYVRPPHTASSILVPCTTSMHPSRAHPQRPLDGW